MAIVDSKSTPATDTSFDANADFHITFTYTHETDKYVTVAFRYDGWDDQWRVETGWGGTGGVFLKKYEGSWSTEDSDLGGFTNGVEYTFDIYGNGTAISVDKDDVEVCSTTSSYNEASTGGYITHNLDSNDLELESWPHGEPTSGTDITVSNVGSVAVAGLNPLVSAGTGLWEVGAYIYDVIGDTQINVGNVGTTTIAGKAATVLTATAIAVGNVGAVAISGLAATITNAVASAGDGITRIAMKMSTIMRR